MMDIGDKPMYSNWDIQMVSQNLNQLRDLDSI